MPEICLEYSKRKTVFEQHQQENGGLGNTDYGLPSVLSVSTPFRWDSIVDYMVAESQESVRLYVRQARVAITLHDGICCYPKLDKLSLSPFENLKDIRETQGKLQR